MTGTEYIKEVMDIYVKLRDLDTELADRFILLLNDNYESAKANIEKAERIEKARRILSGENASD